MSSIDKPLLRLAAAIHTQLVASDPREPPFELPEASWDRCVRLAGQIRRAQLRGWALARVSLLADLHRAIPAVQSELTVALQCLRVSTETDGRSTINHVYQDLIAIREEFEELDFDIATRRVSVTTEPIDLEGVFLGPFEIQLRWARGGSTPSYRVIAKDPHPAESRENVTHPHVMDEVLCEGEGRHAIRQALAQGRLLDFFLLVAGVLRTYNSESPYVELALWRGSTCSDCGAVLDDDDIYACQKCGCSVCSGCEAVCDDCEESCCADCICSCAACKNSHCHRCLKPCDHCQERVCSGCLDESERCPNCHDEECPTEDDDEADVATTVIAAAQSYGLGEAVVPA